MYVMDKENNKSISEKSSIFYNQSKARTSYWWFYRVSSTFANKLGLNTILLLSKALSFTNLPSSWLRVSMMFISAIVLFLVTFTETIQASTPEFKRGGVYLSGDVILGKIII